MDDGVKINSSNLKLPNQTRTDFTFSWNCCNNRAYYYYRDRISLFFSYVGLLGDRIINEFYDTLHYSINRRTVY